MKLWEIQEGKQAKSWTAHGPGTLWVNYSPDGRLVTCGRDNTVAVWDGNGAKLRKLHFSAELPLRAIFSQDGKRIFTSDFAGTVSAWNAADGKPVGELNPNPLAQVEPPAAAQKHARLEH